MDASTNSRLATDEGKSVTLGHGHPGRKDSEAVATRLTGDLLGEA